MAQFTRRIPQYKQPQSAVRIAPNNPLGIVDVFNPLSLTNNTSVRGYTPTVSAGTITSGVGQLGKNIILPAGTVNCGLIISSDADDLFPSTTDATIFVVRRSLDTTARESTLFGYDVSTTDRVLCHASYSDGNLYFDFGGTAANQRISVSFAKSTSVDYLVFVAGGGKGREVWRNGVKIAGDTSKNGSRATTAGSFRIGATPNAPVVSDSEEIYLFGVANRAWADIEISSWFNNVNRVFPDRIQTIQVPVAGIAFDAAGNSGDIAAASSYSGAASWSGTNRMLAVDVSCLGPGVTVTAMTYGGATCTKIGSIATVTSFGSVESWRICSGDAGAPAAGSNTLSVTMSGSLEFTVEWASYQGVHQSSPTEGFSSAQATNVGAADATTTVTRTADNAWVHGAVVASDTTITANQTSRNNISGTLGSGANQDSGAALTPAGNTATSYTNVAALATWAIAGYAIRPVAASGVTGPLIGGRHLINGGILSGRLAA